jgi:MFS family permease
MNKVFYGSISWFIVTIFVVYSFCLNTAAAVFSESIKTSLHLNNLEVSLAIGAFIIGFALMQIPAGYLLDKYNTRLVISSGVLLLTLGNIMISFANNALFFSIANLVQGIGASFAFIAAGIVIAQWFPPRLFPILFGFTQTISCILTAVIHYIFCAALANHTWNEIYQILALCGTVLFLLALILIKSPAQHSDIEIFSLKKSLCLVLKNKQICLCAITATTSFGTLLTYASFWYLNVQKFYSVQALDSVAISGLIFVGVGIGTPLLGWISNRLQSRKLVIHSSLCLGTMFLLMCLYLPHYQINTLVIIKLVSLLTGLLLAGSMLLYTVVSELSSQSTRGVALSITNTGVFLFNSLLMFIPYLFMTHFSSMFFTYLWILPFCIIASILLNYFIKESYEKY